MLIHTMPSLRMFSFCCWKLLVPGEGVYIGMLCLFVQISKNDLEYGNVSGFQLGIWPTFCTGTKSIFGIIFVQGREGSE